MAEKDIFHKQVIPVGHPVYPDGAVILKMGIEPRRVLKLSEYEAEKKAKITKAEKLKYDSDK